MGLESGQFINSLDVNNPRSEDKRRFGDDHLRLIKSTLKNSFPNVNGAINATVAQMNHLVGVTSNIQTQLNSKLSSADINLTPYGRMDTYQSWTRNQRIVPVDHGNQSGSLILNMQLSDVHIVRVTNNINITFSNIAEGMGLTLKLIQGKASGPPPTITIPGTVRFAFNEAPVYTTVLNHYDIIVGRYLNGILACGLLRDFV